MAFLVLKNGPIFSKSVIIRGLSQNSTSSFVVLETGVNLSFFKRYGYALQNHLYVCIAFESLVGTLLKWLQITILLYVITHMPAFLKNMY